MSNERYEQDLSRNNLWVAIGQVVWPPEPLKVKRFLKMFKNYENLVFNLLLALVSCHYLYWSLNGNILKKKWTNKPVLLLADFAHFSSSLNILRKHLTLRGSGGQTTWPTATHKLGRSFSLNRHVFFYIRCSFSEYTLFLLRLWTKSEEEEEVWEESFVTYIEKKLRNKFKIARESPSVW